MEFFEEMQPASLRNPYALVSIDHELDRLRNSVGATSSDRSDKNVPAVSVDANESHQPLVFNTNAQHGPIDNGRGELLQTFWLRAVICAAVPTLIAIIYACLWSFWLRSPSSDDPVANGRAGGRWVFYIWFAIGAFGLNLSKFGLAGAEAAMLMDERWCASNAMQLIIHCDKTWSNPMGWFYVARNHFWGTRQQPTKTWWLLASISLLPFVALPLSGFTMELSTGYASGKKERAPLTGQNQTTFPVQYDETAIVGAFNRWKNGSPSQLLGMSAFYVPETTSGKDKDWLQTFPNVWPDDQNTTVLIAPQSDKPVRGSVWGLRSTINCTTVSSIKQFTLLSQRSADGSEPRCPAVRVGENGYDYPYYASLPDGPCPYDVYVQTPSANLSGPIGQDLWFWVDGFLELAAKYHRREDESFNGAGMVTLEAALWQAPIKLYAGGLSCPVGEFANLISNNLSVVVSGLNKTYIPGLSFYNDVTGVDPDYTPITMSPVGVRCESSLTAGSATIDGLTGTFNSFKPVDFAPLPSATLIPMETAIPKILRGEVSAALTLEETLGFQALANVVLNNTLLLQDPDGVDPLPEIAANASWLANTYRAVDVYDVVHPCGDDSLLQQLRLLNSEQFKTAIVRAHQAYAIELSHSSAGTWFGDLTYAETTTILTPGKLSPLPVLILLGIWAIASTIVGVVFATRPRWAETLDGFSMFRFGSDYSGWSHEASAKPFRKCVELLDVPGLVGDSRPDSKVGHVTLVQDGLVARRGRRYA